MANEGFEDVDSVKLFITDLNGRTMALDVNKKNIDHILKNGIGFDASSIAGLATVEDSDKLIIPIRETLQKIELKDALNRAEDHLSGFLLKQTREKDLALFVRMARIDRPQTPDDVPLFVLVPSFIISELKTAFQMGFILFLPFIIIDMVIASILLSMGMFMLPPIIISTPFKILLFILVDGWHLIGRSLAMSFQ